MSEELALDSGGGAHSYINNRLANAVLVAEDRQILSGDGISPNLLGILNTPGLQNQAVGAGSPADGLRRGIGKIAAHPDFQASGVVVHPNDWMESELQKGANRNYLVGSIFVRDEMNQLIKAPSIWGRPSLVRKQFPRDDAFNAAAQLFRRPAC